MVFLLCGCEQLGNLFRGNADGSITAFSILAACIQILGIVIDAPFNVGDNFSNLAYLVNLFNSTGVGVVCTGLLASFERR